MVGFDGGRSGTYMPVVEHSRAELAGAAKEVVALPEGAVVVGMLSDYAVMREQAKACW